MNQFSKNASISKGAKIAENVSIWDFAQVRENVLIGTNTVIGSYAYIDANVVIGDICKIQNRASIYDPAQIGDGVFIGPSVILTNDRFPRAVDFNGKKKSIEEWTKVGVKVLDGASIGSGSVCIAPVTIGKWALVGAGSIVTRDVKNFSVVVGNPARQIGWVGRSGVPLVALSDKDYQCPETLTRYKLINGIMDEMM